MQLVQYTVTRTKRMFGNDWLQRDKWITLSLIVDCCHAELIFLSLVQASDVTFRRFTVLADRRPLAGFLVFLLDDVVTDWLATSVLQSTSSVVSTTTHSTSDCVVS